MTHEFFRAVETYRLNYGDLKRMVRTGIEHSFLPGESLWQDPDRFKRPAAACSAESLGAANPSPGCAAFLQSSEKAQQQWELERRFHAFESSR
jgi:adenosine deaminase